MPRPRFGPAALLAALLASPPAPAADPAPLKVSGIYPHLASYNGGGECGIGAVVPWAGRLWWITYPPHARRGSPDKLHSVGPDLALTIHPESVGGTHANRLIHRESNQLLIGPYVIDADGKVRAFDVKKALVGRLTATARHLTDPANKVYYVDMEGSIYEADVRTLAVTKLFEKPLPGWHGKGAYTGQGRLVVSNNGEATSLHDLDRTKVTADLKPHGPEDAGVLGEWDGKEWRIVARRQFTDVTGPGGIAGNATDTDPLWAMGWDKRSVILKVLDGGAWHTFRLPKGSYAFDPKHGWYTEWPRIRDVGGDKALMVMHGTLFDFPKTFAAGHTAGIRPVVNHLRYIPDVCGWDGRIVLAADDTSIMQNPQAGQSQSNLWFGTRADLAKFGPPHGWGGPWAGDAVKANAPSDPYLFAGYGARVAHLSHASDTPVTFTFETDAAGNGKWQKLTSVTVPAKGAVSHVFPAAAAGEWVQVTADRDCAGATCYLHYGPAAWPDRDTGKAFAAVAKADGGAAWTGGLIRPAKHNRNLQFLVRSVGADGKPGEAVYYEVDEKLQFTKVASPKLADEVRTLAKVEPHVTADAAGVVLTDAKGQRFRLPRASANFAADSPLGPDRTFREVVSERALANLFGTFYELPRAEGTNQHQLDYRRMKPVATHGRRITDFCSWRGLLVLAGTRADASPDGQYFAAAAGGPGLWFGTVDDLWRFGKPVGVGGPWKASEAKAGVPSDPYLMTNFDRKRASLSHDATGPVTFRIEADVTARGEWVPAATVTVPAGATVEHAFPPGFAAHWVRVVTDADCRATAWLVYE